MALFQRRGSGCDTGLKTVPMIDCVFLLFIFVMVSAITRTQPPFSATLSASGTGYEFPRGAEEKKTVKANKRPHHDVTLDVMERAKQRFKQRISRPEGIEYHIPTN